MFLCLLSATDGINVWHSQLDLEQLDSHVRVMLEHCKEFKADALTYICIWVVFSKSERSVFFSRFLKTFTIKQFKFGSADNSDLGFCNSWYQSQPPLIIHNVCRESWQKLTNMKPTFQCSGNMSFFLLQINGNL